MPPPVEKVPGRPQPLTPVHPRPAPKATRSPSQRPKRPILRDEPKKRGCRRSRPRPPIRRPHLDAVCRCWRAPRARNTTPAPGTRPLARCAKRDPEPASAPQQAEYYETNPKNGGTAEAASARPSAGQTSTPFVDVGAHRAPTSTNGVEV